MRKRLQGLAVVLEVVVHDQRGIGRGLQRAQRVVRRLHQPRVGDVGIGNPARAALAGIHHHEAAVVARQVRGSGQAGGAGPDNKDIQQRLSGRGRRR